MDAPPSQSAELMLAEKCQHSHWCNCMVHTGAGPHTDSKILQVVLNIIANQEAHSSHNVAQSEVRSQEQM